MSPAYDQPQFAPARLPWAEFALVVLVVVASSGALFKFGVASLGWAAIYLGIALLCLRDHARVIYAAGTCWPLLLFPLFCLLSVFWSAAPADTLRHAFQYLFTTMIGLWIGAHYRIERLFEAMAVALGLCVVASAFGAATGALDVYVSGDYVGAERYFVGLFTQKNVFGVAIVMTAQSLHVIGAARGTPLRFALLAALLIPVLIMTQSTTALLLYLATWLYYPTMLLVRRRASLPLLMVFGVTLILGVAVVVIAAQVPIVSDVLALFGKDATMTGRTVIWSKASEIAMEQPFLGIGYQAFWESARFSNDVMLIRAAVLESIGGFHNGYLEAMVATGVAGLLLYVIMLISTVVATVRAALEDSTPAKVGAVFVALVICSRTATESTVYYQHDLEFVLLIAFAAASALGFRNHSEDISDV